MKHALPTVAVVGRPNVGKSTFFNRLVGHKLAIVQDTPGVTRDRHYARAEWAGHHFWVVDTGGLQIGEEEPLAVAIRTQVEAAIQESDLIVFLVDGREGPQPMDERIAELLRKSGRPILLVVNKMDRLPQDLAHHEFWELGLGEPLPVSAISGKGTGDLLDQVVSHFPEPSGTPVDEALRVAVIGKPNVGKSSLINKLLGEDRLVVSDVAGTTRDAIDTPMRYHGRDLIFVDTAGLRRHARIAVGLEYYSSLRTERAIERSDVCVLLIDGTEPAHVQDLKIAELAWRAGRGLIIVVNKWDVVEKETNTAAEYQKKISERAPQLKYVPFLFTSALTGQRVQKVLEVVLQVAEERQKRISTSEVNDAIRQLAERQPPPHYRGMRVKILYATQAGAAPPTFVVFVNHPKGLTDTYIRYLRNSLREFWPFTGSPIRLRLRGRREEKEK
ncbi:MAG TPA: ribosome biogenesis GTPase Der [Longimicrobiales bacterium]